MGNKDELFQNVIDDQPISRTINTRSRRRKSELFDSPTPSRQAAAAAKGKKNTAYVGQYKRQTILIPPSMDEHIREIAEVHGVGLMELYRWLLDAGISAHAEGELERSLIERRTVDYLRNIIGKRIS